MEATGGLGFESGVFLDVVYDHGKRGGERAAKETGGDWRMRAALGHAPQGREKGTGASGRPAGVMWMPRRIDCREGEARGGRERRVNGREHDSVLQSASLAGMHGFSACTHASTCFWGLWEGVNKVEMALDALGSQ